MLFGEDSGRNGDICASKAMECSVLGELLCRSLEDKNVEGSAKDGVLACDVPEGSLKTLWRSFVILN